MPLFPYQTLDSLHFDRISPAFQCIDQHGVSTDAQVRQFLRMEISARMRKESPGILFSRLGWHTLGEGRHIYVAGNRIIGETGGQNCLIAPALRSISLTNTEEPNTKIFKRFRKAVKKEPDILIPLVAYCLRSLLITPFAEAGYPLRFVLYLMGKQGVGKTTTAKKFAQPFDQCDPARSPFGMIDAGSTPSALRATFSGLRDVPALLDDFAITSDPREQQRRKATVSQILRFVSNDGGFLRSRGNQIEQFRCGCGMIVTAELPLEAASDVTRCATVFIFHQMEQLTDDDRALTAAVMSRFLAFFASNYNHLVEEIRRTLRDANRNGEECPRQHQIYEELKCCFRFLLLCMRNTADASESKCDFLAELADEALSLALMHNRDLLDEMEKKNLGNPARIIQDAIENNEIKIAKNLKKFSSNLGDFDGLRTPDGISILPRALAEYFSSITGRKVTENEVGRRLRASGLVQKNAERRTASWKRKGLPRMILFDLEVLKKQAKNA